VHVVLIVLREDFFKGRGPAVLEIRSGAPDFDEGRCVQRCIIIVDSSCADVVGAEVCVKGCRVAAAALGLLEQNLASLRRFAQLPIDEEGAGNRFQRNDVGVHCLDPLLGRDNKLDVPEARPVGHLEGVADSRNHDWGCLVRKEKTLRLFGIAHAVVEEIPVEGIDPPLAGMAARAALPLLETEAGVFGRPAAPPTVPPR